MRHGLTISNGTVTYPYQFKASSRGYSPRQVNLTDQNKIESKKTLRRLLFIICIHTGIWPQEMRDRRTGPICIAKNIYYYIAKKLELSTEEIIAGLLNKDHSTVNAQAKRMGEWLALPHEQQLRILTDTIEFKFKKTLS